MGWPRAVVFDLDGTLIDSAPDLARSLNIVLTERNRSEVTLKQVHGFIGDGVAKLVERGLNATANGGAGADDETRRQAILRFLEIYEAAPAMLTRPYAGVVETLARLRSEGRLLAVCTNKPGIATAAVLSALGLDGFFGAVVGGDTLPVRKPDPAPLRFALEQLGVTAGDALMVGDNEHDAATAAAAGLPCLLVSYGYAREPLASLRSEGILDRFDEIPARLAALAAARVAP
jgi:phosphoglycolate phosphatase